MLAITISCGKIALANLIFHLAATGRQPGGFCFYISRRIFPGSGFGSWHFVLAASRSANHADNVSRLYKITFSTFMKGILPCLRSLLSSQYDIFKNFAASWLLMMEC
jgi:hypothetical protein